MFKSLSSLLSLLSSESSTLAYNTKQEPKTHNKKTISSASKVSTVSQIKGDIDTTKCSTALIIEYNKNKGESFTLKTKSSLKHVEKYENLGRVLNEYGLDAKRIFTEINAILKEMRSKGLAYKELCLDNFKRSVHKYRDVITPKELDINERVQIGASELEKTIEDVANGSLKEKSLLIHGIKVLLLNALYERRDVPSESYPLVIYVRKKKRTFDAVFKSITTRVGIWLPNSTVKEIAKQVLSKANEVLEYITKNVKYPDIKEKIQLSSSSLSKTDYRKIASPVKSDFNSMLCPKCGTPMRIDPCASVPRTFDGELKPRFICPNCGHVCQE